MASVRKGETLWNNDCFFSSVPEVKAGALQNVAMRVNPQLDPSEFVAAAARFFCDRGKGFFLWTEDSTDSDLRRVARENHFAEIGSAATDPVMALSGNVHKIALPATAAVVRIEDGNSSRNRLFTQVIGSVFDTDPQIALRVVNASGCGSDAAAHGYVLLSDGVPVTCAVALQRENIQGIYMVGTRPQYRNMGFGAALVSHVVGQRRFGDAGISVLESTDMAAPMYARMGFKRVGGGPAFIATAEQAAQIAKARPALAPARQ
ncbi:GNAT family N-acetyltransferase [Streptomyces sp. NBC_01476]|uniref:GNAT family N-acetyltransferase n=1 Tax=Streptomyces sp. NBC_01476 TaxID=2903881 RepID=UPI002E312636|nr:GNAT family N-acetyltransferase [Streptomyces sp. NBC_01476]